MTVAGPDDPEQAPGHWHPSARLEEADRSVTVLRRSRALSRVRMAQLTFALVLACGMLTATLSGAEAQTPPIRTSAANQVPHCVTPERLMAFLRSRNPRVEQSFAQIAHWYKVHGERWSVRWDYAFFQMAIETNFLSYRRPDGRMGDVDPRQNNFAGIGTTGGGVPGDSYPDVSTGVLAQIQHLVVYSGERIEEPVAPRTRLKQDHILRVSEPIREKRPLTFRDLAGRWAADRAYGRSIEWVATQFRDSQCRGQQEAEAAAPRLEHARAAPMRDGKAASDQRTAGATAVHKPGGPERIPFSTTGAANLAPANPACSVMLASYGNGRKTILIRADRGKGTELTALTVLDGFETSMADTYIRTRAPGGEVLAHFENQDEALKKAYALCPSHRG